MDKTINSTELIVKATMLEDGLLEQVENMIINNPRLFDGEKVVLMADVHKTSNDPNTNSVPVGFTMTLSKGLVPVDYVSADMFCGVSSCLIKDYIPTKGDLIRLSSIARDIIPVDRRIDYQTLPSMKKVTLSDLGTLGNGNHFVEVGTNGIDTLISVHSGSRSYGGKAFKLYKNLAIEHTKKFYCEERSEALKDIEPKDRQKYLKSLPKKSNLPLLDTNQVPYFWEHMEDVKKYASTNREIILKSVLEVLKESSRSSIDDSSIEFIETVHNYVDTSGDIPIVRKGSIQATNGDTVIVPINMKDGIIVGKVSSTEEVNYSLPHGAGRVLSRTQAFNDLDIHDFIDDMKDVVSPTINAQTLDESPRAYKDINVIIKDIEPYLSEYEVFKPLFNYKGV